jgi:hypothetical protein
MSTPVVAGVVGEASTADEADEADEAAARPELASSDAAVCGRTSLWHAASKTSTVTIRRRGCVVDLTKSFRRSESSYQMIQLECPSRK